MDTLEQRVEKIEARNAKVEADKAWEGSLTRKTLIVVFTYVIIGLYLEAIEVAQPWINAIVPTVGFTLSTLTMPFFKKLWVRSRLKQ